MAKGKQNNKDTFWETASENYREVRSWPEWMQSVTLNASTIDTGLFFESSSVENVERKKKK